MFDKHALSKNGAKCQIIIYIYIYICNIAAHKVLYLHLKGCNIMLLIKRSYDLNPAPFLCDVILI